ncbi:MAG: hypothetical protein HOW73_47850 [Polyangiaceae bacterium]|nr:hypothetical protein [Polyangiaceae bacterium]
MGTTAAANKGGANVARNQVFRSTVSVRGREMVVSTIRFRDGAKTVFETALSIDGAVSDVERSNDRGSASVVHDRVCDIVRGYHTDPASRLVERTVCAAAECFETIASRKAAA